MDRNGVSAVFGRAHGLQAVDVVWWECPDCETIVGDFDTVETKRDRVHARALGEKANREARGR